MRTALTTVLACCLAVPAVAAEPDLNTPEGAIQLSVAAFRDGDLNKLIASMPESEVAQMKALWEMKRNEPGDPMQEAEFNQTIAMLKSDEAVNTLFAQMQPGLAAWDAQKQQMAGQLGIVQLMLPGLIAQNQDIPEMAQLQQLTDLVPALQQWILTTDFGSEDKAKEMLGMVHAWAKGQDWNTVADLKTKDFDSIIGVANELIGLGKDIGGVYGIDTNAFLDSVTASSTPGANENESTLMLGMTLLGKPLSFELPMVKTPDGKWQPKNADKIEQKMNPLGGGAPGAGAPGAAPEAVPADEPATAPF